MTLIENKRWMTLLMGAMIISLLIVIAACGDDDPVDSSEMSATTPSSQSTSVQVLTSQPSAGDTEMKGTVEVDGSSTVYPISEAVAEEFNKLYPKVRVNVGVSGTGGGFKRFYIGETDVSDASRTIRENEIAKAEENGIKYVELRLGTDGLSVIVSPKNDFVDCLSLIHI